MFGCQHDTARICCWAPSCAIDRYLLPSCGALSSKPAARRGCCCRSMGQTDGQTDAGPFHRICCVHCAGSVNKDLKYELAMQDSILCFDWVLTIIPRTCVPHTRHKYVGYFGAVLSSQWIAWLGTEKKLYPKNQLRQHKVKVIYADAKHTKIPTEPLQKHKKN